MDPNQEITEALVSLHIEPKEAIVDNTQGSLIIERFRKRFIKGNPTQYWLSFSVPFTLLQYEDLDDIHEVIIGSFGELSTIYLLTENDYLLRINSSHVVKLLAECSFFEYYLFDKDYTQVLCETDHNELLYINISNVIFQRKS